MEKGGEKMARQSRFIIYNMDGRMGGIKIVVDTETGVQYLSTFIGYAGGLTVLVDKDGKPLLNKDYRY